MVASTLAAGDVAIVAYHTDNVNSAQNADVIRFVLLAPIGSGTQIFFTDRNWNGTVFNAAGGGDGTFTYTAGGDLPAGTVITITNAQLLAAGINLADTGETLYIYQGAINAPTTFLYAADIADGNTVFTGSLVGTGLTAGVNAVAVAHDNAVYSGSSTQIRQTQLTSISTSSAWQGSDQDDIAGTSTYSETSDTTLNGPLNNPDMLIVSVMAGGGQSDAILTVDNDENANVGTNLTRLFRDNAEFNHLSDITWDIEAGFFFVVDSDGNSINRILRGNISDLRGENATPTLTQIFITDNQSNGAGPVTPGEIIVNMEINTTTNKIYWMDGNIFGDYEGGFQLLESNYDGTGLRLVTTIDTENPDPGFGFPGGVGDFAVYNTGNVAYVVHSTASIDGFGNADVLQNHILQVDLTTGAVTILGVGADATAGYNAGRLAPAEGQIIGIDVDQRNGDIYFITQPISSTDVAGIFKYVPGTDTLTELWTQPSNASFNTLQTFPTSNMTHIEFDEVANRYYVSATSDSDTEHDGTPGANESDASIFIGNPAGGAPTLFVRAYEPTANGAPQGMEIDYAPTITGLVSAGSTYTESTNALASPAGTPVQVANAPTIDDADQVIIQGATVAITTGFMVGDTLGFTNSGGITGSYNAATGVITFTGNASFAAYQTVLDSITYVNAGDNPTNYGASPTRVISFTVTDGLLNSDPATATVNVVGINDAPVNVLGANNSGAEDAASIAVTGISVSDVDANPATQDIRVTLSVDFGTLTLLTNVVGGIQGSDIVSGNGTGTVVVLATQNEINATLAAATGLLFAAAGNVNGVATLTVTTNDQGLNGNDPGLTGTGTTEQDSDTKTITVNAVNDAPTIGDGTETAATVTEDTPGAGATVSSLFGGQFSDAADNQTGTPSGSSANTFTGIAVTANGSSAGTGQWQYFDGAAWQDIGTASTASAQFIGAATLIRFTPIANYNGPAGSLTAVLVDSSVAAPANGTDLNLSGVGATGGTTQYSSGTVVLSQADVVAVNDAPVASGSATLAAVNEDTAAPAGATVSSLFSANFSDAADDVGASTANGLAGVAIIANAATTEGTWQYFDGVVWTDLPAVSAASAFLLEAADSLRFVPAADFNGAAPALTVRLVEDSAGAITTGSTIDLSGGGSTGGATEYSAATVTLNTSVTAVNDAPAVNADTTATFTEGAGPIAVTPNYTVADIDSANLTGATITIADLRAGDVLGFTDQNGITGAYDSGTGVLTLTGTASVANYQAAIGSITYDGAADANFGGTDNTRTVNIIVTDGVNPSVQTATVIGIQDAGGGDAQDDAFTTTESTAIVAGDLFADNGNGADTTPGSVTEVNGQAADVGTQITLASGALLTVNSDGSFDYDPNGAFDDLVDASSGAANGSDTDSFTYTVDGGDVATVTITINGETDAGDAYNGTAGNDTISGGATGNTINGLAGDDTLNGLGGGDVINGGDDNDTLNGGDQGDKLNGDNGNDQLNGDEGNDILMGGAGADDLVGGNGSDVLDGGAGADDMNGGAGNDIFFVDDAGDTLTDASGLDTVKSTLSHTLGADFEHLTLLGSGDINGTGNSSNNTINGNDGVNVLAGMDGADKLYGMGGKDNLDGGAGADVLDGGDANDIVHGGTGNDTAVGGSGNDSVFGDDGNDQLDGGIGADKVYGGAGLDQLTGGVGNDYMYGGADTDTLTGGDGNDYLDGENGPDKMYGGLGNDVYIVNEYNDFISENVGEGYDVVRSSAASYILGDNLEALELMAGAGDIFGTGNNLANAIIGNEGVNILDGKAGVDTIKGGDGNDVIFGGAGNDLLYGQNGYDIFAVRQESVGLATLETDRIFDLNFAGGDRVDLSAIDANSTVIGDQAFQFAAVLTTFSGAAGEATLTYDAATNSTYLRLDVNGDKKADYSLRMDGDHSGTSGSIIAPGTFLDGTGGWIL